MTGWWTALRIARREAARAKGRSALVVALIGLPVLALAFAAVTYDSFRLTPEQEWERGFGSADAHLAWWHGGPVQQSPDATATSSESRLRTEPATEAEVLAVLPAIATGLAAADRRDDLAMLGAVGASPRVRRLLSLSQSGVIAGLGTLLGVAAGIGAAFAVLLALNQRQRDAWPPPEPYPIEVPWAVLAILLAVPLVAMLGAGLLTRSRLPIERRLA